MRRNIFTAWYLALVVTLCGCATLPSASDLQDPSLQLVKAKLKEVRGETFHVEAKLWVSNPNRFPIEVDSIHASLWVDGTWLGTSLRTEPLSIGPHQSKRIFLPFYSTNLQLPDACAAAIKSRRFNFVITAEFVLLTREGKTVREVREAGTLARHEGIE